MDSDIKTIAYQGIEGSYSHAVCQRHFADATYTGCAYFEDVLAKVESGEVDAACIPIENNVGGRVAEIHHLLTETTLYITREFFFKIAHCLLSPPGATQRSIRTVHSHPQALIQCRRYIVAHGYTECTEIDTAVAARGVASAHDPSSAAIASAYAADIYGLDIVATDVANHAQNITRFVLMQSRAADTEDQEGPFITSVIFQVRSIPAALYRALGGFAAQGVNLHKIESYIDPTNFSVAQFYIEIEGEAHHPAVQLALSELQKYSSRIRIVGSYPAAHERGGGTRAD